MEVTNYRGQVLTYAAAFEVIKDYLEGRREYSFVPDHSHVGAVRCHYRQDRKPECAVACLVGSFIPDEEYDPEMENTSALGIRVNEESPYRLDPEITDLVLNRLQSIHDNLASKQPKKALKSLEFLDVNADQYPQIAEIKTLIEALL